MAQEQMDTDGHMNDGKDNHPMIDVEVPQWFNPSIMANLADASRLVKMVSDIEKMNITSLKDYVGGDVNELPYEILKILFPRGSDDSSVGRILGNKRIEYLKTHPEEAKATQQPYYIDPHGVTFPDDHPLSSAELRTVTVGNTCIHYESDVPGMDDVDVKKK